MHKIDNGLQTLKDLNVCTDDKVVDLSEISRDDEAIYYKDAPYTPKDLSQRLIITYSPKYAKYQKTIRKKQVDRAKLMLEKGSIKKKEEILMIRPGFLAVLQ